MHNTPDSRSKSLDRVILLLLFALFLLVSPLKDWWATPESPWYLPYLLWLLIIALAWLLQRRHPSNDL